MDDRAQPPTRRLAAPPPLLPQRAALFVDLDGTLAAIEAHPSQVGPDPRRTALMRQLGRALDGRLAVVSGRSLEDLDRVLQASVPCLAGVHGLVRRDASLVVTGIRPHPGLAEARRRLQDLAESRPGLWVEDKGQAMALHYRATPAAADEALETAKTAAADLGLVLQPGDMVVEVRSPGSDKGVAVTAFMAKPPFVGHTPVFVGDDLTDEHGFAAAAGLGGYGVLVGKPRPTAAAYHLADVSAVNAWLSAALVTS
jgi:trehalose 6-phosphate phosphatase